MWPRSLSCGGGREDLNRGRGPQSPCTAACASERPGCLRLSWELPWPVIPARASWGLTGGSRLLGLLRALPVRLSMAFMWPGLAQPLSTRGGLWVTPGLPASSCAWPGHSPPHEQVRSEAGPEGSRPWALAHATPPARKDLSSVSPTTSPFPSFQLQLNAPLQRGPSWSGSPDSELPEGRAFLCVRPTIKSLTSQQEPSC